MVRVTITVSRIALSPRSSLNQAQALESDRIAPSQVADGCTWNAGDLFRRRLFHRGVECICSYQQSGE